MGHPSIVIGFVFQGMGRDFVILTFKNDGHYMSWKDTVAFETWMTSRNLYRGLNRIEIYEQTEYVDEESPWSCCEDTFPAVHTRTILI